MVIKNRIFSLLMGALFTLSSATLLRAEDNIQSFTGFLTCFSKGCAAILISGAVGSIAGRSAFFPLKEFGVDPRLRAFLFCAAGILIVSDNIKLPDYLVKKFCCRADSDLEVSEQRQYMEHCAAIALLGTYLVLDHEQNILVK